jgi:hypothetical protein
VAFASIYQMVTMLLGWIVRHARSDTSKEIEIGVLRHQLAVLRRRAKRPTLSWTDRALIAALSRLRRTPRRLGLLATPAPSCDPEPSRRSTGATAYAPDGCGIMPNWVSSETWS